jgi:uncharacterized protein (TIGR02452 family)
MKAELAKQRKLSAQQYSQKLAPNAAEARSWVSWCFNRSNPGEPPTSLVAWARERGDTIEVKKMSGGGFNGSLHFGEGDMISFAAKLSGEQKERVCVLNMANRTTPGGGFLGGSRAQEEQLCHRSDLFPRLKIYRSLRCYPIKPGTALLTPQVDLLLQDKASGFAPLPHGPARVAVLSAAGNYYRSEAEAHTDPRLQQVVDANWRAVLTAAGRSGAKVAVLSALGCGAFHNPAEIVAASLARALREPLAFGSLERVCVIIMEDHNSGGTNVARFRGALEAAATSDGRLQPMPITTSFGASFGASSASSASSAPSAPSAPSATTAAAAAAAATAAATAAEPAAAAAAAASAGSAAARDGEGKVVMEAEDDADVAAAQQSKRARHDL